MKSFRDIEHRTVKIDCQVDIEEATVNWYFDGIEILKGYPDWFDKIKEEEDAQQSEAANAPEPLPQRPKKAESMKKDNTDSAKKEVKQEMDPAQMSPRAYFKMMDTKSVNKD